MVIRKGRHKIFLILSFLYLFFPLPGQEENNDAAITINLDEIENDGRRVEIQRYIGYEDLLSRYLTLPYDVGANTSNQGRYFDIGYVIFSLLPIIILLLFYKNKKLFYTILLFEFIYLCFLFNYSFINVDGIGPVYHNSERWELTENAEGKTVPQSILIHTYNTARTISTPAIYLIKKISGQSDHITYAALFLIFCLVIFLIKKKFAKTRKWLILSILTLGFSFMWLILSGGIIWYGFFIIPIAYAFIFRVVSGPDANKEFVRSAMKWISLISIIPWLFVAYAARISNIDQNQIQTNTTGALIVNPQLFAYTLGIHNKRDARDFLYRNNTSLFDKINSNNDLIYQVGTSFTFDIKNNPTRIYHDNTLDEFFRFVTYISKDKDDFISALKQQGCRYIIIDLYTPTLDKTPEQSLLKKYQLFLNTIYQNDQLQLLATDRIVEIKSTNGTTKQFNDVFGIPSDPSDQLIMKDFGSYAIYEIL